MHSRQINLNSSTVEALDFAENETVYLVTGANRGIGWTLVTHLALRPNTVIVACVRQRTASFAALIKRLAPSPPTTRLLVCELPDLDGSVPSSDAAWASIQASLATRPRGFRIDVLIANAGINPPYVSSKDVAPADMRLAFGVNAIGPLNLFRTFRSSLLAAKEPKFVVVSSSGGSIELGPQLGPMAAYGSSKAAVNYLTRKIHFDEERITTLAICPGFVQTDMGQIFADVLGMNQPPLSPDESVARVLQHIDGATKTTSGQFLGFVDEIVPW